MKQLVLGIVLIGCVGVAAQGSGVGASERFQQFISQLPEMELPAFCPFYASDYNLAPDDSLFFPMPDIPDIYEEELSITDVSGTLYLPLKKASMYVVLFVIGDEYMSICTYRQDGTMIDSLLVKQHYYRDHVVLTNDYTLRTIDNLSIIDDAPLYVEKQYQIEANGNIRFLEEINYRALARPWVEETRNKRKEEVEYLSNLLLKATPEEANTLYDNVSGYFTETGAAVWYDYVDQLNFSYEDTYVEYSEFWTSMKVDFYNFLDSAWYVHTNNAFYYELFKDYVTDDYREALKLFIVDDYTIEDSEELRMEMEEIALYIIEREQYVSRYPTSKHNSLLLEKCPEFIKSFLFCDGINTAIFEHYDKRTIHPEILELITDTKTKNPDSRLAKVIELFLNELKKTNNGYSDDLKETVMQYVDVVYKK